MPTSSPVESSAEPVSLLTRKQQFVRGAIWDAAVELFARKGFNETTVDEIAKAAGVSRRSFFRYFSSKNDLMGEAMVLYGEALSAAIAECPPACSSADMLRQTLLQISKKAAEDPRTRKIMQITATNPGAREAQLSRRAEVEGYIAEAFARRSGQGREDDMVSRLLAGVTMSVFDATFRSWFERGDEDIVVPAEQALATLRRLFCQEPGS